MNAVAVFSILVVACALAVDVRKSCKESSDCEASQCCVDNSRWMIASKRDIIGVGRFAPGFDISGGTCVNYLKEGASCHYLGFTSCGCEPGTACKYYAPEESFFDDLLKVKEEKEEKQKDKRVMIARPGNSFCRVVEEEKKE